MLVSQTVYLFVNRRGSVYAGASLTFDSPVDDTTPQSQVISNVQSTINDYLTSSGNVLGIDSQNMQLSGRSFV